ncbi:hypothetical protein GCM10020220_104120 [Nonomuraea rubra]
MVQITVEVHLGSGWKLSAGARSRPGQNNFEGADHHDDHPLHQDKNTLRIAAYGAVALMAAAGAAGRPGKIAANGSIALGSATGPIGHVLPTTPRQGPDEASPWAGEIATACCRPDRGHEPAAAAGIRPRPTTSAAPSSPLSRTAQLHQGQPSPAAAEMARK